MAHSLSELCITSIATNCTHCVIKSLQIEQKKKKRENESTNIDSRAAQWQTTVEGFAASHRAAHLGRYFVQIEGVLLYLYDAPDRQKTQTHGYNVAGRRDFDTSGVI